MNELDPDQIADILLEFIEAFFHQVIYVRQLYSHQIFEKTRLYGIVIQRARHPELHKYIHDIIADLKLSLVQGTLQKIVLAITTTRSLHEDITTSIPTTTVLEQYVIQPSISLTNNNNNNSNRQQQEDLIDIQSQLRAALLKLSHIDATLPDLPENCSFDVFVHMNPQQTDMPGSTQCMFSLQSWIQEKNLSILSAPTAKKSFYIVPIKSCLVDNCMTVQCYLQKSG